MVRKLEVVIRTPFVSIVIPVFNGSGSVGKTIKSLEALRHPSIEFLLSDNMSEDDSLCEARNAANAFLPELKIFEQPSNIGLKKNCEFLVQEAKGEFVWIMSAGEVILAGDAQTILAMLEANPGASNFVLTGELLNKGDATRGSRGSSGFEKPRRPPFEEAISMNIVRRELYKSLPKELLGEGDVWPHLEAILSLDANDLNTVFSTSNVRIGIAQNYDGWWFHGPNVWNIYFKKLSIISEFQVKNPEISWARNQVRNLRNRQFLLTVIEARKNGVTFSKDEARFALRYSVSGGIVLISRVVGAVSQNFLLKIIRTIRSVCPQ